MDEIVLAVRVALAVIFLRAGIMKFVNFSETKRTMSDFGVPLIGIPLAAVAVPACEIVVAALLLTTSQVFWGGVGAVLLLLVFMASIAVNLLQGRHPKCNCFGANAVEPISTRTLVRNCVLLLVASTILWQGNSYAHTGFVDAMQQALAELGLLGSVLAALSVFTLFQTWLLVHAFRQLGRILLKVDHLEVRLNHAGIADIDSVMSASHGLPVGELAPSFSLADLHGKEFNPSASRNAAVPFLLIFSDVACSPCNDLVKSMQLWPDAFFDAMKIVVVSRGTLNENQAKFGLMNNLLVLTSPDRSVAELYGAAVTPSAVLINTAGLIGSPLALGADQIFALASSLVSSVSEPHISESGMASTV